MKSIFVVIIAILLVSSAPLYFPSQPSPYQPSHSAQAGPQTPKVSPSSSPIVYINSTFVINEFTIDPLTGLKGQYGVQNPIVINPTGHLIVDNATLYFLSSVYNNLYLDVNGGNLTILNGVLTVAPDMIGPNLNFTFLMGSGSVYLVNSKVMFSGALSVSGGTFKAINTDISGASSQEIQTAIRFGMNSTYAQNMQYVPALNFSNAYVYLNNATISPMFKDVVQKETFANLTVVGNGLQTFNMYLPKGSFDVPNQFTMIPSVPFYTLSDVINITIYYTNSGNYTDNSSGASISIYTPAGPSNGYRFYQSSYQGFPWVAPGQVGMVNYTIKISNITPIMPPFLLDYYLNKTIWTNFYSSQSNSIEILSEKATFFVPKNVSMHMSQHVIIFNSTNAYIFNSYIDINYNINVSTYDTLFAVSNTNIYWYNTSIENSPMIVSMPFVVDSSSTIYIYRNAVLNARNFDNTTVSNIAITVKPYDLYTGGYNISSLNNKVWSKISFSAFYTNSVGIARIPLLSDVVNYNFMPNSLYLGNYNITFINPVGGYLKNITISLMHFPLLQKVDNNYVYTIKFNIPDFQLVSLNVPQPLIIGHTYSIVATVIVYGGPAVDSTSVLFTLTGGSINITLGQVYITLAKNVSQQVSISLNLAGIPYGYYNITANINPGHTIFETNYMNNVFMLSVPIYPDVDFAVLNANITGKYLYHPVNITFSTKNLGTDNFFTANLQVYYIYNAQKYTIYSSLVPSSLQNFSFSFVPSSPGAYFVYINLIQPWDYNQSNNMYSKVLYYNINYNISRVGYTVAEASIPQNAVTVPIELNVFVNCSVMLPQDIPALMVSYSYNGTQIGTSFVHYIPNEGAVASFLYNVKPGMSYVFNVTINSNHAYPETNYLDDSSSIPVSIPVITGYVVPPAPTPFNGNATFAGALNITSGSLTNASLVLTIGNKMFVYPIQSMFAYSSMPFILNQSVSIFNITQPNVTLPYKVAVLGAQLGGSSVILGSGWLTVYHPANVSVVGFGIQNSTTYTVGMYVPFLIKFANTGGISSAPFNVTLAVGNDTVPIPVPSIPAGGVYVCIYDYNLTMRGAFATSLHIFNQTLSGPTIYVIPATYTATAIIEPTKVMGNQKFNVTVLVINVNASAEYGSPVYASNVLVTLKFAGQSYQKVTSPMGTARFTITAPTSQSGSLPVVVSISSAGAVVSQQVGVVSVSQPFPWVEFTIAFVLILIGAVGYFMYSANKRAKLKKRRVCPVCGSSIYEGATACPVCGAQLSGEVENCSTCDTIIPKYSKYCPNCGEIFIEREDVDFEYLSTVKAEYDEKMDKIIEEYRRSGRPEADFYKWWLNNPGFISFRYFLLKTEYTNKKKECPNCGAINDLTAEVCINCHKQLPPDYTIPPPILDRIKSEVQAEESGTAQFGPGGPGGPGQGSESQAEPEPQPEKKGFFGFRRRKS
jgi:predicted amidophosphoribosyltransferase